jgi:hypothetical protein
MARRAAHQGRAVAPSDKVDRQDAQAALRREAESRQDAHAGLRQEAELFHPHLDQEALCGPDLHPDQEALCGPDLHSDQEAPSGPVLDLVELVHHPGPASLLAQEFRLQARCPDLKGMDRIKDPLCGRSRVPPPCVLHRLRAVTLVVLRCQRLP